MYDNSSNAHFWVKSGHSYRPERRAPRKVPQGGGTALGAVACFRCPASGSGSGPGGRGGAIARRDFHTRSMALRWWCWRRGCSWTPAARSPRPGRPGCAGPLGTHAAWDTRAQVRPGRARCSRRKGHRANDSQRPNEWEDTHVLRGLSWCVPWVGRRGRGNSRGARSAEPLPGHPGYVGAEVGKQGNAALFFQRDLGVSTDSTRAKGTSDLTFLALSDFRSS